MLSNLEKRRGRRYNYFPIWPWLARLSFHMSWN
jgi:hypothetical protein